MPSASGRFNFPVIPAPFPCPTMPHYVLSLSSSASCLDKATMSVSQFFSFCLLLPSPVWGWGPSLVTVPTFLEVSAISTPSDAGPQRGVKGGLAHERHCCTFLLNCTPGSLYDLGCF